MLLMIGLVLVIAALIYADHATREQENDFKNLEHFRQVEFRQI